MVTEAGTELLLAGTIDTLFVDPITVQSHVTPFAKNSKSAACAVIVKSATNSASMSLRAVVGLMTQVLSP